MRAALLLPVALLLAGCMGEDGGFGFARSGGDPLAPYFQEYRELVSGSHTKLFDVPIEGAASLANITVLLDSRTNGLPAPETSPARLEVRLLDPMGAPVREAALDPQRPVATIVAEDLPPGLYHVEITGFGASHELDGTTYGAGYVVSVEILYE